MSIEINYEAQRNFIFIEVHGELSLATLKYLATEVAQISSQSGCKNILNDLRDAQPANTLDIYNMPLTARNAGIAQSYRRALVVGEREKEFCFLETVFINQGHQVRMFAEIDDAKKWLLGK